MVSSKTSTIALASTMDDKTKLAARSHSRKVVALIASSCLNFNTRERARKVLRNGSRGKAAVNALSSSSSSRHMSRTIFNRSATKRLIFCMPTAMVVLLAPSMIENESPSAADKGVKTSFPMAQDTSTSSRLISTCMPNRFVISDAFNARRTSEESTHAFCVGSSSKHLNEGMSILCFLLFRTATMNELSLAISACLPPVNAPSLPRVVNFKSNRNTGITFVVSSLSLRRNCFRMPSSYSSTQKRSSLSSTRNSSSSSSSKSSPPLPLLLLLLVPLILLLFLILFSIPLLFLPLLLFVFVLPPE
mmetsp:Transcript_1650/g.5039  ORF Transcript_1650/g.5039 Transcript_1650/m.5039 type:complete len:304 (+) Transcript_1650:1162-2073(+)